MKIKAIKTRVVEPGACTLEQLFDESIESLPEKAVVTISSKVVALCQNRIVPMAAKEKPELVAEQADWYLPEELSRYGFTFTLTNRTMIASAGIDASNVAGDNYVLWPAEPQKVAEQMWRYLRSKHNVKSLGVIITDSTCMPPLRAGVMGISLAHCGFLAVEKLIGEKDLFGREFQVASSAIAGSLAVAANLVMGESAECTPIAVVSEVPFVKFQDCPPTEKELEAVYISPEDDLYAPFLSSVPWQKGGGATRKARL